MRLIMVHFTRARWHMQQRRGYSKVTETNNRNGFVQSLISAAITRDGLQEAQKTFIKIKKVADKKVIKIVNNRLRSTVLVSFIESKLNTSLQVEVFFKKYRKNTIASYGLPCKETVVKTYDLANKIDCDNFVTDIEEHMAVTATNLKTINEQLPVRMKDFQAITNDSLFAMEIHSSKIVRNNEDPLNSHIELWLVSNLYETNFTVKVSDIINHNDITDLIGMYVVFNYKYAFKIKTKDEINRSYRLEQ